MQPTEIGRLNEAFRRRWGFVGSEGPVVSLATDLFPVVRMDDEGMDADMHFLAGSQLAWGGRLDGPVAGSFAQVTLSNPPNSGVVGVVEEILMPGVDATATYTLRHQAASADPVDTEAPGFLRDSRTGGWNILPAARANLRIGDVTTVGGVLGVPTGIELVNTATLPNRYPIRIVLGPDSRILVSATTETATVRAVFLWRERVLTKWERG